MMRLVYTTCRSRCKGRSLLRTFMTRIVCDCLYIQPVMTLSVLVGLIYGSSNVIKSELLHVYTSHSMSTFILVFTMSCSHALSTKEKAPGKNRKFPRKQTPWNSHRPTPDGAVDYKYNKSTSNAEEEVFIIPSVVVAIIINVVVLIIITTPSSSTSSLTTPSSSFASS